jgi:hypothetical protein
LYVFAELWIFVGLDSWNEAIAARAFSPFRAFTPNAP